MTYRDEVYDILCSVDKRLTKNMSMKDVKWYIKDHKDEIKQALNSLSPDKVNWIDYLYKACDPNIDLNDNLLGKILYVYTYGDKKDEFITDNASKPIKYDKIKLNKNKKTHIKLGQKTHTISLNNIKVEPIKAEDLYQYGNWKKISMPADS